MRNKVIFSLDTGWDTAKPEEIQFIKNFCNLKGIPLEMGSARFAFPRMFDLFMIPKRKFGELRDVLKNMKNEMIVLSIDDKLAVTQIDLCFDTEKIIGKIRFDTQDEVEKTDYYFTMNGGWYAIESKNN